jgi:hypothetical protein
MVYENFKPLVVKTKGWNSRAAARRVTTPLLTPKRLALDPEKTE